MRQAYSFDDVLLVPKYSNIRSRSEVDLSSNLGKYKLDLPVISSPMDTISEASMVTSMYKSGGLGIIHRYNSIEDQSKEVYLAYASGAKNVGAAIGMTGDFLDRATAAVDCGANILCVDVAHGHHIVMEECVASLVERFGEEGVHIMAGNVATLDAFDALASLGVDSIRVGIGGGSICSTRIVTGHGVPTLQSVFDCAQTNYAETKIIADGGIKTTGDMVKALAAGADFVMVGSMLAGTSETPGEVFTATDGKKYKVYRGMASRSAQTSWRGKSSTPEGVSTTVAFRGHVNEVLDDIAGGIRSGLSYSGCRGIKELQESAEFILQTGAGQSESNTHILWRNK